MTLITTPAQAVLIDTLSETQRTLIRESYGINDYPYQSDRTYIVFDATVGSNSLHIITGGSNSYSILKGDGSVAVDYTDTGGTKTLTYAVAGRYIITIDGAFNGISTVGASAGNKNKYIEIIAGSNYPTTIITNAFDTCGNLKNILFSDVTTIEATSFNDCSGLKIAEFNSTTSVQSDSFDGCDNLILLELPSVSASSLVKLDNLNVAVDLNVDGESNLDNISLGGDIIPETTETHDLGSSTNKMQTVYTKGISFDGTDEFATIDFTLSTWNMASTSTYTLAHGISNAVRNIKSVCVHIVNDINNKTINLLQGGYYEIDSTNIVLNVTSGGVFTLGGYSGTTIGRGSVIIEYLL